MNRKRLVARLERLAEELAGPGAAISMSERGTKQARRAVLWNAEGTVELVQGHGRTELEAGRALDLGMSAARALRAIDRVVGGES